jgi:uncharacterized protein YxeA
MNFSFLFKLLCVVMLFCLSADAYSQDALNATNYLFKEKKVKTRIWHLAKHKYLKYEYVTEDHYDENGNLTESIVYRDKSRDSVRSFTRIFYTNGKRDSAINIMHEDYDETAEKFIKKDKRMIIYYYQTEKGNPKSVVSIDENGVRVYDEEYLQNAPVVIQTWYNNKGMQKQHKLYMDHSLLSKRNYYTF